MNQSDAVILMAFQLTITYDSIMTINFQKLGMYFCAMDSRQQTQLRFLDDAELTVVRDYQEKPDSASYYIFIDTSKLLFRISYQDVLLLTDLYARILGPKPSTSNQAPAQPLNVFKGVVTEKLRINFDSIQAIFIDDVDSLHLPVMDFQLERSTLELNNWSTNFSIYLSLSISSNYFNLTNANWEPVIEACKLNFSALRELGSDKLTMSYLLISGIYIAGKKLN